MKVKKSYFFFVVINRKKDLLLGRWNSLLDRKDISIRMHLVRVVSWTKVTQGLK